MYLKYIELQGFKSFPIKTKLTFERGATVIVGPNGSGKSNIADAMRWVLGEISAKSLRGGKMEDIIFGGADTRKPMSFAEVTVCFDNTASESGRLDCIYDEVRVTRRYFRNGNSEYQLNGQTVRLKDIYELFLNTGIGRDGYSIIGQGRIAEIISRKSDERRNIFEDAAGIAKYRHSKDEAERKLARTEDNMERAQDILDEIGSRLGPLERESIKAKRFVEYSEIKKEADIRLWLYDSSRLRTKISDAEAELGRAELDFKNAAEALETLEHQRERLSELSTENKMASEQLLDEINRRRDENHKTNTRISVAENEIVHANAQIEHAKRSEQVLRAQAEAEQSAAGERRAQAEAYAREIGELSALEARLRLEQADADRRASVLEDSVALAFDNIVEARNELSDASARLELLGRSTDESDGKGADARREIDEYESRVARLTSELAATETVIASYESDIARTQAEADGLYERLTDAREALDALRTSVADLCVNRRSTADQIENLRRLEEHFEGYLSSIKHIMTAYREGSVRKPDGSPCGTIYGPLSTLISVKEAHVTAIETALGQSMQNIVVDNEETVRAAISKLKRDNAGRATFYALSSVRRSFASREMQDAKRFKGYIGIASELVTYDKKFDDIISSVLGRLLVFDNLENATEMARAEKYNVRVVTLDGQQINSNGSFTGGSVRVSSGILTRLDKIKNLNADLARLDAELNAQSEKLSALQGEVEELEGELSSKENTVKLLVSLRTAEGTKLEKQRAGLDADNTLLARLRADLDDISGENERRAAEISELEARSRTLEEKIEALSEYREGEEIKRNALIDERDAKAAEILETTLKISKLRGDIETANAIAQSSDERARAYLIEASASLSEVAEAEASIRAERSLLEALRGELDEGDRTLEELLLRRRGAEESNLEYERKTAELNRQIKDRQEFKEKAAGYLARTEEGLSNMRTKLDTLAESLWIEHQLTRAQALEFGYPPIADDGEHAVVLQTQTDYRNKIRNIGSVNVSAIEEYTEVKKRHTELSAQMDDLNKSREELISAIHQLEHEMEQTFVTAFEQINENFGHTFRELFGGGSAEIILTDPEHVLECGIEIKAAPPGKIIKSIMQLSGGEQSFVSIALFFAILKVNPTPFCILDEIEAALDEVNVERFAQYISNYSNETQFILISHRRGTMNAANKLYGVTMPERGISKVIDLDVDAIAKSKGDQWDELFG